MKPITVWERYSESHWAWEHNHIEDGHTESDIPLAHNKDQANAWKKGKWNAIHAHLDENNIVVE